MKVNGINITAREFAYDGCHKIYLLDSRGEVQDAMDCGYGVLPIEELRDTYESSCGLRFINTWSLDSIVQQGDEAVFEGFPPVQEDMYSTEGENT